MAERVGIAQLHHLLGQEPQRPMIVPRWRGRAGGGNHMSTLFVGQFRRLSRSWPVVQGRFDAFLDTFCRVL